MPSSSGVKKIIVYSAEVAKRVKSNFSNVDYVADQTGKFIFSFPLGAAAGMAIEKWLKSNDHSHDVQHH